MSDLTLFPNQPTAQTGSALDLYRRWLRNHRPGDPISDELRAALPAMKAEADAELVPIGIERLAVYLAQTLELWKLPDNWASIAAFYVEALSEFHEDVIRDALHQARTTLKWFPKPCELRDLALPMHGRRLRTKAHLMVIEYYGRRMAPAAKKPEIKLVSD